MALNGQTPAQVAGIETEGTNKVARSLEGSKKTGGTRYYQVILILAYVGIFGSIAVTYFLFKSFLSTISFWEEATIGWLIVIPWLGFIYWVSRRIRQSLKNSQ
jgi:hypothetical protein